MRATLALLAIAGLVVAILAACRGRDEDVTADSAANDNAPTDGSTVDSGMAATDTATPSTSVLRKDVSRARTPATRRAEVPPADSHPSEDSIRAMRPEMPQVTTGKRPRTWRGFKLPEERPVRIPLDTAGPVEPAPDSLMKGDSTKPPKPNR